LLTPVGDLPIEQISSEEEIRNRVVKLNTLNTLWYKRSFMVMYNELTVLFDLHNRLRELPCGERSSGNFNTLADILGEEAFMYTLTPRAVLNSLLKHINAAENDEKDSFPGMAETDQGTVIIDTVFGSKGLSYPIVFLPDLCNVGKSFDQDKLSNTFHQENELVYAPLAGKEIQNLERNEKIQESLRIAYVALTRARYYCRIYCGKGRTRCAATDWLFRDHGITDFSNLYETLKEASKGEELRPPIHPVYPSTTPSGYFFNPSVEILRRPDLQPFIVAQSGFLSFSSITPHGNSGSTLGSGKEDEPDSEFELPPVETESEKEPPIPNQQLPGGTGFGNAIHEIMEFCDFTSSEEVLAHHAGKMLSVYGISGKKYASDTAKMLHIMLNTPIPDSDGGFFKFSDIAPDIRKSEFEFLYEFKNSFKTHTLFEFANGYFSEKFNIKVPGMPEENSTFDNGFFNGSIDLFFRHGGKYYIVDWKTNKLETPALYANGKLKYAMAESRYYLQYMIYTAALFKYLKQRLGSGESEEALYDKYFGGVRYIFLRGFTGAEGQGIFSDRLSYADLKKLEEIIG
jgi:exodeoxyribonuclease V beta subunit